MKYMGSKSRIAKHIVPIIQESIERDGRDSYIEPFVGGANVIDKITCKHRVGFDINEYLTALLQYVQIGGVLPSEISRETYAEVRQSPERFDPWFVGCVGFLASYNGKFFGGYAGKVNTKIGTVRDYYDEARRNLMKQAEAFKGIGFVCMDYRRLDFRDCAIYCDPPYVSTTGYSSGQFDHAEFWDTMRRWSRNNTVFISEQTAPADFICVWEGQVTRTQDNASRQTVTEKLFRYEGSGTP